MEGIGLGAMLASVWMSNPAFVLFRTEQFAGMRDLGVLEPYQNLLCIHYFQAWLAQTLDGGNRALEKRVL